MVIQYCNIVVCQGIVRPLCSVCIAYLADCNLDCDMIVTYSVHGVQMVYECQERGLLDIGHWTFGMEHHIPHSADIFKTDI